MAKTLSTRQLAAAAVARKRLIEDLRASLTAVVYCVVCRIDGSLIGIYSSQMAADARIARAQYPDRLCVQRATINDA